MNEFTWEDVGAPQEMREALVSAFTFAQLFHPDMVTDPKSDPRPYVQLGIAVMLGKPVIVICDPADEYMLPAGLRKLADEIAVVPKNDVRAISDAVTAFNARMEREGRQ